MKTLLMGWLFGLIILTIVWIILGILNINTGATAAFFIGVLSGIIGMLISINKYDKL